MYVYIHIQIVESIVAQARFLFLLAKMSKRTNAKLRAILDTPVNDLPTTPLTGDAQACADRCKQMLRVAKLRLHATSGAGTARLAERPQQRNPATGAAGESMSGAAGESMSGADTASGSRSSAAAAAAWSCEGASHGKSSHAGGATPDSLEPPPSLLDAPPGEDLCDVWVKEEQKRQKREDIEKKKRKTREENLLASLEAHKKRRELSPESSARNSSSGSSSGTPTSPRHWEAQTMQHTKDKEKQEYDEEWVERELWLLQKTGGICVDLCFSVRPQPGENTTIFFRDRRSEFRKLYEDLSLRKLFYIGIAADPKHRWENAECGHVFTFDAMHLLAYGCSTDIGDFEDFLIKHAWLHHGQRCLNQHVGRCGQGTRDQQSYLYLCSREKRPEDDEVDQCNDNASTVRKQFLKKQEHWASIIDSMYDR